MRLLIGKMQCNCSQIKTVFAPRKTSILILLLLFVIYFCIFIISSNIMRLLNWKHLDKLDKRVPLVKYTYK